MVQMRRKKKLIHVYQNTMKEIMFTFDCDYERNNIKKIFCHNISALIKAICKIALCFGL